MSRSCWISLELKCLERELQWCFVDGVFDVVIGRFDSSASTISSNKSKIAPAVKWSLSVMNFKMLLFMWWNPYCYFCLLMYLYSYCYSFCFRKYFIFFCTGYGLGNRDITQDKKKHFCINLFLFFAFFFFFFVFVLKELKSRICQWSISIWQILDFSSFESVSGQVVGQWVRSSVGQSGQPGQTGSGRSNKEL